MYLKCLIAKSSLEKALYFDRMQPSLAEKNDIGTVMLSPGV